MRAQAAAAVEQRSNSSVWDSRQGDEAVKPFALEEAHQQV